MVFGSYAIFQALLNKELIGLLLETDNNLLGDSNKSFLNLIILFVFNIIGNIVLYCIVKSLPENLLINNNVIMSNTIASVLIFIHLYLCFLLILEVIIFATNLYRMFCLHNTIKALDIVVSDDKEK